MEWVLQTSLHQFEAAIAKRSGATVQNSPLAEYAATLDTEEANAAAGLIQQWLLKFGQSDLNTTIEALLAVSNKYKTAVSATAGKPSMSDKKSNVDDLTDNTVDFMVLDTIARCIGSSIALPQFVRAQSMFPPMTVPPRSAQTRCDAAIDLLTDRQRHELEVFRSLPSSLASFALSRLAHQFSSAVRAAACRCLSLLSRLPSLLVQVVNYVVDSLKRAKKDDELRAVATVVAAIGSLEWTFHPGLCSPLDPDWALIISLSVIRRCFIRCSLLPRRDHCFDEED